MSIDSRTGFEDNIGPKMADGRFRSKVPHSGEHTPDTFSAPLESTASRLKTPADPSAINPSTGEVTFTPLADNDRLELERLRQERGSRRKRNKIALAVGSFVAAGAAVYTVSQISGGEELPESAPQNTTAPSINSEPTPAVSNIPNGSVEPSSAPTPSASETSDILFPAEPSLSEIALYATVEVDYATRIEPFIDTAERDRLVAEYPEIADFLSPQNKIQVQLAASPEQVYARVSDIQNYAPGDIVQQYGTFLPEIGTIETIQDSGFASPQDLGERYAYLRGQTTTNATIMYDAGYTNPGSVYSAVYWNDEIAQERTASFLELKEQGLMLGDSFRNATVIDAFSVPVTSPEVEGEQIFFATAYDVPADQDDPDSAIIEKVVSWNVLYTVPSELRWTENENFELVQGMTDVDGIGVGVLSQATLVN